MKNNKTVKLSVDLRRCVMYHNHVHIVSRTTKLTNVKLSVDLRRCVM